MPLPRPLPVAELPAIASSYPATTEELSALCGLSAGDQFLYGGLQHIATADASPYRRDGFAGVLVKACRVNPAMPSGWELADVIASRRAA